MTENSLSSQHADSEAIQHLKQATLSGENWYVALLEAISLWGSAEETYNGRHYSYLNYFYGVVAEEALLSAIQEEVSKEQGCFGLNDHEQVEGEAYRRIYGAEMQALLDQFRNEKDYPHDSSITP